MNNWDGWRATIAYELLRLCMKIMPRPQKTRLAIVLKGFFANEIRKHDAENYE